MPIDEREIRIVIVVARQIESSARTDDPDRRIELEPYIDRAIDIVELVRAHDDRAVCKCKGTHDHARMR